MRCPAVREVCRARAPSDAAQLVEVLLVRQRGVLVEPLRRQQLRRRALGLAAVLQPDARAHEGLRRLR